MIYKAKELRKLLEGYGDDDLLSVRFRDSGDAAATFATALGNVPSPANADSMLRRFDQKWHDECDLEDVMADSVAVRR